MKIPTSLRYQIFNSGCLFCCLDSKIWTSVVAYLLYKKFKFMSSTQTWGKSKYICTVVCKVGSYIIENFNYKTDFLKEFLTNAIFLTSHSCLELQELLLIFQEKTSQLLNFSQRLTSLKNVAYWLLLREENECMSKY